MTNFVAKVLDKRSEASVRTLLERIRDNPGGYFIGGARELLTPLRGALGGVLGSKLDAFVDAVLGSDENGATQEIVDAFNALWRYTDPAAKNEDGIMLGGSLKTAFIKEYTPEAPRWSKERILRSLEDR